MGDEVCQFANWIPAAFFPAAILNKKTLLRIVQKYSIFYLDRICRSLLLTIDDRLQRVNLH